MKDRHIACQLSEPVRHTSDKSFLSMKIRGEFFFFLPTWLRPSEICQRRSRSCPTKATSQTHHTNTPDSSQKGESEEGGFRATTTTTKKMAPSNPPPQTITPCPLDLRNRISLLLATKQSKAQSLFGASLPQPTTSSATKTPAAFSSLASGGQKNQPQESQRRRLEDEDDFTALEPNVGIGAGRDAAAQQKANAAREDLALKRKLLGKRQREDKSNGKYGNRKPEPPAESDDEDEGRSGLGRNKKARRNGPAVVGKPKEHPLVAAAAAAAAAAKEQAGLDGEDENGCENEDTPESITKSSVVPNKSPEGLDTNPSEPARKKKKKKKKKPKKKKTEEDAETPENVLDMEICG